MKSAMKLGVRIAAVGTLAAAVLMAAPFGTAPARAAEPAAAAAACRVVVNGPAPTIVRLWYCDGTQGTRAGYHGQGMVRGGGQVYLKSATGQITALVRNNGTNQEWIDTTTVGDRGAPWRACMKNPNFNEHCSAAGRR